MSAGKLVIPAEDAWIIERISQMLTKRLVYGQDAPDARRSLFRLLFGLQRLPIITPGLNLSVGAGDTYIEISHEWAGFVRLTDGGHTSLRLQYFESSQHCIYWHEHLMGPEKRELVEEVLMGLESDLLEPADVLIEDHSDGAHVDLPPLDDYLEHSLSREES